MSLEQKLNTLASAIGADVKALRAADGNLSSLNTTAKNNLVAALNEVLAMAQAGTGVISDVAGDGVVDKTWSADKIGDTILASINALRNELTNGASAALDTFGEIATQLAADQTASAALATAISNRVRFDAAQTLTNAEQLQARENINAASATDLSTLTTAVGNTEADLVAVYTTALGA